MPVRVGISQRIVQTVRIQIPALWIGGILARERIVRTCKPSQRRAEVLASKKSNPVSESRSWPVNR